MKISSDGNQFYLVTSPKAGVPKQFEKLIGGYEIKNEKLKFRSCNELIPQNQHKPFMIKPSNISTDREPLRSNSNKRNSFNSSLNCENPNFMRPTQSASAKKNNECLSMEKKNQYSKENLNKVSKSTDFKNSFFSKKAYEERNKTEEDVILYQFSGNQKYSDSRLAKFRKENIEGTIKSGVITKASNLRSLTPENLQIGRELFSNQNFSCRAINVNSNRYPNEEPNTEKFSFLKPSVITFKTMDSSTKMDNKSWHESIKKANKSSENKTFQKREIKSTSVDRYIPQNKLFIENNSKKFSQDDHFGSFQQEKPTEMYEIHDISDKLLKLENRIMDIKNNIENRKSIKSEQRSKIPFESSLKIKDINSYAAQAHSKTEETKRQLREDSFKVTEISPSERIEDSNIVKNRQSKSLQKPSLSANPKESVYSIVLKSSMNGYFASKEKEKRESASLSKGKIQRVEISNKKCTANERSMIPIEKKSPAKSAPNSKIRNQNEAKETGKKPQIQGKPSESKRSSYENSFLKPSKCETVNKKKFYFDKADKSNTNACLVKKIDISDLKKPKIPEASKSTTLSLKDYCTQIPQPKSQENQSPIMKKMSQDIPSKVSANTNIKLNKNESDPNRLFYISNLIVAFFNFDSEDYFETLYRDHFLQCMQAAVLSNFFKQPSQQEISHKILNLPKKECYASFSFNLEKKTLVFDLDETLVHCNENGPNGSDMRINIRFPSGDVVEVEKLILGWNQCPSLYK